MKGKIILFSLAFLLLVMGAVSYAGDAALTKGISYDKWITLNLEKDGLVVREIIFKTDTEAKTGRFGLGVTRGPYATFVIVNNSGHDMEYGVAVALFDKNHTLITASDFAQVGKLDSGERNEYDIVFGPVNMRYKEASYFKIVLEAK
ncbi:MAG: hypothetical protein JW765_03550 [Deltaproteobacteria bacterium]|nr:hypothetical protein [Candidatus Zymogenaceae bacterium]